MGIKQLTSVVVGIFVTFSIAQAFSTGPPDARTGAPGDSNCTVGCHSSFSLNSGNGNLSLTVPPTYLGGDTLDITVNLNDPGQMRWGFELTVLDGSNNPVGNIVIVDASRTQKSTAVNERQYIKHTSVGTNNGTSDTAPGWDLRWAAPATAVGTVTFYVAGNAANGNNFNTGDYIYTSSASVDEEILSCCVGVRGDINGDGANLDIVDLTCVVDFLFGSGCAMPCDLEADANGDGATADIVDLTFVVDYLFGTPPTLVGCP